MNLINTGLQAGDIRYRSALAVSTAFIRTPVQPVSLDEFL